VRVRAKKESSVEFVWERFVCVCVCGVGWLTFGEFGKREREFSFIGFKVVEVR
jgi:hypothetical protein